MRSWLRMRAHDAAFSWRVGRSLMLAPEATRSTYNLSRRWATSSQATSDNPQISAELLKPRKTALEAASLSTNRRTSCSRIKSSNENKKRMTAKSSNGVICVFRTASAARTLSGTSSEVKRGRRGGWGKITAANIPAPVASVYCVSDDRRTAGLRRWQSEARRGRSHARAQELESRAKPAREPTRVALRLPSGRVLALDEREESRPAHPPVQRRSRETAGPGLGG